MINGEKCYPYFTLRFFSAIYNNIETIVFFPLSPLRNRNEHNRVANECFKETFLRRKVGESKRVFSKEGRTSPRIPPFKAHSHFPRKSDESSLGVGRVEEATVAHLRGQVIRNVVAKNCKKQR